MSLEPDNSSESGSEFEEPGTAAPGDPLTAVSPSEPAQNERAILEVSPEEQNQRGHVHVPENLHDLITGAPVTEDEAELVRRRRLLSNVIHQVLTVGLILSTAAMVAGLGLDVFTGGQIPQQVPQFREALKEAVSLRAGGFLALGLLILIATPIIRVLGSLFAFVYERDWRYAGITLAVAAILALSLVLGKA